MYVLWFPWLQRTIEQWRRRGGEGHSVSQDIRPGAGFKTGDFVEEKLGGATVERRKYQNNDDKTIHPQTQYPSMYWRSSMHVLVYYYISFATSSRRCIAWVSKTRNMMKEHSNIQMKERETMFRCFQHNRKLRIQHSRFFIKNISRCQPWVRRISGQYSSLHVSCVVGTCNILYGWVFHWGRGPTLCLLLL